MGNVCCAINCPNSLYMNGIGVQMYPLPEETILRRIWLRTVGRPVEWQPTYTPKLCEKHFVDYQYINGPDGKKYLSPISIPRAFDYTTSGEALEYLRKKFFYKAFINCIQCVRNNGPENELLEMGNDVNPCNLTVDQAVELEINKRAKKQLLQQIIEGWLASKQQCITAMDNEITDYQDCEELSQEITEQEITESESPSENSSESEDE